MKEDCSMESEQMTIFFVQANSRALCLICRECVRVSKDRNLKRHYVRTHAAKVNAEEGLS